MKKWLKIWMLTMAFLAAMTVAVSTWKVNAEQDSTKKVEVSISDYNSGNNNCVLEDYTFSVEAKTEDQTVSTGHTISCIFWDASQKTVTLELSGDLSNWSTIIPATWVKLTNATWVSTPDDIIQQQYPHEGGDTFIIGSGASLVTKFANKIGDATWTNVEISVTIPAWTPNGTYEGTLVLTF